MKKGLVLSTLLCSALLAAAAPSTVFANSAQMIWSGTSSSGVLSQDMDSPIEVTQEVLTLDLPEPPEYYMSSDYLSDYPSTMTAEYTFYNPSDYTVTSKLFFPFGTLPEYYPDSDENGDLIYSNPDIYNVLVDGVPVEKEIRHSYSSLENKFYLKDDYALLKDDYVEDPSFAPDMPVTQYSFHYSGIDDSDLFTGCIHFRMKPSKNQFVYFKEMDCYNTESDGTIEPGCSNISNSGDLTVYVFGTPEEPDMKIEDMEGRKISGKIKLKDTTSMTLEELLLSDWSESTGVSKVDWYNSMIEYLNSSKGDGDASAIFEYISLGDGSLESKLMQWYSYEVTLEPGQELVNTVIAPMFPQIDDSMDNTVYDYEYLLSPAKTWNSFGTLDIQINTPFYMISNSLEGWEEDEYGYSLSCDGLPDGELEFSLCGTIDPQPSPYPYDDPYPEPDLPHTTKELAVGGALIIGCSLLLIGFITVVVVFMLKKKK